MGRQNILDRTAADIPRIHLLFILQAYNFDLLGLFPNIWTDPILQRTNLPLFCDFVLHTGIQTWPYRLLRFLCNYF